MSEPSSDKSFSASYARSERFTPPKDSAEVVVTVDGETCPGTISGRNGPRTQVRYQRNGDRYVRWFDTGDVIQAPDEPDVPG